MSVIDRLRSTVRPAWRGDPDTLYQLISNSRRRFVTEAVANRPMTHDELATELAENEYGAPINSAQRKRVYIALHQVHLDKLLDAGVIQPDGRDAYRPGENHAAALSAIEAIEEVTVDA